MRGAISICWVTVLATLAGCGGRPVAANHSGSNDGFTPTDAGTIATDAHPERVPQNHRAAGSACPAQRGSGSWSNPCNLDGAVDAGPGECTLDSECTTGTNGRCLPSDAPFRECLNFCSYDGCFGDSDCLDNVPCDCRGGASDTSANECLTTSNCRVDADCGPGGFCSPSEVHNFCFCPSPALCTPGTTACYAGTTQVSCACGDACGHGYFCHTKTDSCVDDRDCASGETCNYDTTVGRWDCAICWPVP
jgi:hypothetical protein